MGERPLQPNGDVIELECAHCGDLIEVTHVPPPSGTPCPACGELVEVPQAFGADEPVDVRITGRFSKLPRRV